MLTTTNAIALIGAIKENWSKTIDTPYFESLCLHCLLYTMGTLVEICHCNALIIILNVIYFFELVFLPPKKYVVPFLLGTMILYYDWRLERAYMTVEVLSGEDGV